MDPARSSWLRPSWKRAAWLLLLALVMAGGATGLWRRGSAEGEEGFVTEALDRGAIVASVTATGTVNPVSTVQVGTYVSGPIRAIDVDFNSPVTKGQRVAKIDPAAFQVKVQQAEANLANAEARVRKAASDLALKRLQRDRQVELRARSFSSESDLDTARSNAEQAEAQVALENAGVMQARAALEEARINLAYTDITSPVDGVVVARNVDVGQTVAASFQTPTLFLIAQDLTKMQVNSAVSESDIGNVQEGQKAIFRVDAYPDRNFEGRVVQVRNAPTTVQNVVTYDVVIAVDNPALALKPGMTASVTLTTDERADVVRIPARALRFDPARVPGAVSGGPVGASPSAVYVVEPAGTLRRAEVSTGLRSEQWVELLSGDVAPGDDVAVAARRPAVRDTAPTSPFSPPRMR